MDRVVAIRCTPLTREKIIVDVFRDGRPEGRRYKVTRASLERLWRATLNTFGWREFNPYINNLYAYIWKRR